MSGKKVSKKRELLPKLQGMILALTNMSADAAKLEYYDNDQASRRLKRDIVNFEHDHLQPFKTDVKSLRETINTNKS